MSINIGLLTVTNTAYLCKMLMIEETEYDLHGNSSLSLQLFYKPKTPKNKIYFKKLEKYQSEFFIFNGSRYIVPRLVIGLDIGHCKCYHSDGGNW